MTSHSPASSPELPKLPDLLLAYYASDHVRAYATAHGLACYEAGRASHAAPKWQSMDSAPKDGTEVLLWREDCGQFIGSYTSGDNFPLTQDEIDMMAEEVLFQKDWFTQWPDARRLEGSEVPTRWQHLPTAPTVPVDAVVGEPVADADGDTTSKGQYKRMFTAACEALGQINEALGLDPDDGGAEPILDAIAELKSASLAASMASRAQTEWISVEDRLPEIGRNVLMYRPEADESPACHLNMRIGQLYGAGIWEGAHRVTHWMPLPKPPATPGETK